LGLYPGEHDADTSYDTDVCSVDTDTSADTDVCTNSNPGESASGTGSGDSRSPVADLFDELNEKYGMKDPLSRSSSGVSKDTLNDKLSYHPYGLQNILKDLNTYSSLAAVATGLSGLEPAMVVFAGIALAARGLEMMMYSEHTYVDAAAESLKMTVPAPYSILTDKAIDMGVDTLKDRMDKKGCK